MANMYFRKRLGKGPKLNISHSKSNGFGASLSVGSKNKKGLGWNYNTKSGFTLSLRGTGIKWEFGGGIQGKKGEKRSNQLLNKKEKLSREIIDNMEKIATEIEKMLDYHSKQDADQINLKTNGIGTKINDIRNEIYQERFFYNEKFTLEDLLGKDFNHLQNEFSELITTILINARNILFNRYIKNLDGKIDYSLLIVSLIDMSEAITKLSFKELDYTAEEKEQIDTLYTWISKQQQKEIDSALIEYMEIYAAQLGERLFDIQEEIIQSIQEHNKIKQNLMFANVLSSLVKYLNLYFKFKKGFFTRFENEKREFHNNLLYIRYEILNDIHNDLFDLLENDYKINDTSLREYTQAYTMLLRHIGTNSKIFNQFMPLSKEQKSSLSDLENEILNIFKDYILYNIDYFDNLNYDKLENLLEITKEWELLLEVFETNQYILSYFGLSQDDLRHRNESMYVKSAEVFSIQILKYVESNIKDGNFNILFEYYGTRIVRFASDMVYRFQKRFDWMMYTMILTPVYLYKKYDKNQHIEYVQYVQAHESTLKDIHEIAMSKIYLSLLAEKLTTQIGHIQLDGLQTLQLAQAKGV